MSRLISSAPHIPLATRSGGQLGCTDVGTCDGAGEEAGEEADVETEGEDVEVVPPPDEAGPRCEVTTVAMPALAPATTITLAAARAGAQPRPQARWARGSRWRRCPGPAAWLASRNATSSTVTRRGGSGATRRSMSASCRSSVFMTPHLQP